MTVVLPRLQREIAEQLISEARGSDIRSLESRLPFEDLEYTWPAVGNERITRPRLATLRRELTEVALQNGYPTHGRGATAFDAAAARTLRSNLDLTPYEASQDDMWAYITCAWLLDIAVWRFGANADIRRFIGDINRNTFRRLWWRAEILGDAVDLMRLGEDEIVNILERPTLASNKALAQDIAAEFLATVDRHPSLQRMQLMREATKRLLRRTAFVDEITFDDEERRAYVRAAFDATTAALAGERPGAPAVAVRKRPPSSAVTQLSSVKITDLDSGEQLGASRYAPPRVRDVFKLTSVEAGHIALDIAARTGQVTNDTLKRQLSISAAEAREILQREVHMGRLVKKGRTRGTYYSLPTDADIEAIEAAAAELVDARDETQTTGRSNPTLLHRLLRRQAPHSDVSSIQSFKQCARCERTLPMRQFFRSNKQSDGLTKWCKECLHESKQSGAD